MGATPLLSRCERPGAQPTVLLTSFILLGCTSHLRPATIFLCLLALQKTTHQRLRSRPTSCSSRSTSGRRSTARRPPQTPLSAPERARLPPAPCLSPARVTVACAYVRPDGVIRSQPFPRRGSGRERSLSRGAGASPAIAHWAAGGPLQKVRSSPRASNSPHFCLILTFCLPLLPSLWPSACPADATRRAHRPPIASA